MILFIFKNAIEKILPEQAEVRPWIRNVANIIIVLMLITLLLSLFGSWISAPLE